MKRNRCRHFTGMYQKETCAAGVRYDDVRAPGQIPCLDCAVTSCPSQSLYSEDELAEQERQALESFRRIGVTRDAIVKATEGKQGVAGQIPCPICEHGTVAYRVSGYNGHIHAACTTESCVRWIE